MKSLLDALRAVVTRWLGTQSELTSTLVGLPGGALWSFSGHSDELTLTCHEGWLWLTREGDAKDYVLTAGACVRLDKPGRVVVQALRSARFSLGREEPGPEPLRCRPQAVGR